MLLTPLVFSPYEGENVGAGHKMKIPTRARAVAHDFSRGIKNKLNTTPRNRFSGFHRWHGHKMKNPDLRSGLGVCWFLFSQYAVIPDTESWDKSKNKSDR